MTDERVHMLWFCVENPEVRKAVNSLPDEISSEQAVDIIKMRGRIEEIDYSIVSTMTSEGKSSQEMFPNCNGFREDGHNYTVRKIVTGEL